MNEPGNIQKDNKIMPVHSGSSSYFKYILYNIKEFGGGTQEIE